MPNVSLVPPPAVRPEHFAPGGVYDIDGYEHSHAEVMTRLHAMIPRSVHHLAKRSARHVDDSNHESHAELVDGFAGHFTGKWHVERFDAPIEYYALRAAKGRGAHISEAEIAQKVIHDFDAQTRVLADRMLRRDKRAYQVTEFADDFENLFTTSGVAALWNQAANGGFANSGAAVPKSFAWFNNAQAVTGVGDSSTAAAAGQFDLQAASNRLWVAMDATFPTLPAATVNQIVFRSTYGSAQGNYAWNEFAIANDNGSNVTIPGSAARSAVSGANNGNLLDRVVSAQGTKTVGQTWVPTMTLSIS
jgi:hypothetical protein